MRLFEVVHEVAFTVVLLSLHVNISDLSSKFRGRLGLFFSTLKSVALISFQAHGSNYTRS